MKTFTLLGLVIFVALTGVSAQAATWYLRANETSDWTTLTNWYSQPLGGGTHPTSISSSDYFDMNGYSVTTPKASSGTVTFGGKQLILHGGSLISTKTEPIASIYVANLYSYGGVIQNSAYSGTLAFGIDTLENFYGNTTVSPA
jgi:hypothetical protein